MSFLTALGRALYHGIKEDELRQENAAYNTGSLVLMLAGGGCLVKAISVFRNGESKNALKWGVAGIVSAAGGALLAYTTWAPLVSKALTVSGIREDFVGNAFHVVWAYKTPVNGFGDPMGPSKEWFQLDCYRLCHAACGTIGGLDGITIEGYESGVGLVEYPT